MNIETLVNQYYADLNENDRYIWNYIKNNKEKCMQYTLHELSDACSISKTSIIRFSQKLSLTGYSELRAMLRFDQSRIDEEDVNLEMDHIANTYHAMIDDFKDNDLEDTCEILYRAKRVFAYGSGLVQLNVVKEMARRFVSAGDYIYCFDDAENPRDVVSQLREGDCIIIISISGESDEVVELATSLHLKGIKIISISNLNDNRLAALSDNNLYISKLKHSIGTEEYPIMASSTAMYFLITEFLFIRYQLYKNKMMKELD
ncbi:MurR/RpiR family transcriptional regulator [Erysipelothrix inopinata]|uniref:MurR/RpiR family transcriptional regulator n=1 Tax=Erysipelothrix inopinata TaxID=225084 RepID=A0A7G9RYU2_9FIRM|nr:MurR/RpiR family transcriptional regulator [Erysipelothrix inopinata]QNN60767.1 MurR/RpiR family transcriptional regulator [Erysipelothrix inopinata]